MHFCLNQNSTKRLTGYLYWNCESIQTSRWVSLLKFAFWCFELSNPYFNSYFKSWVIYFLQFYDTCVQQGTITDESIYAVISMRCLVKTFVVLNPLYYFFFFFLYKTNAWLLSFGNSRSLTCYDSLKYFARSRANQLPTFFSISSIVKPDIFTESNTIDKNIVQVGYVQA